MKNKLYKFIKIVICIFVIYNVVWWVVDHPIQSYFANKKLDQVLTLQGTDRSNIKSIEQNSEPSKNTTSFTIYFKDDPNTQYEYRYFLYSNVYLNPRKNNYNKMFCFAYDKKLEKEKN
ncbi:DUF3139 domain-containing protein, partial [Finegoldia magna]|uniref:DUF3139 domain-containing protein n=2 Tax=Peptoniphilaceae TaxID=1570339 RepID=UPI0026EA137E